MITEIGVVGLDVAKNVFQVHGVDRRSATVLRKRLRRSQVAEFFRHKDPCLIGIEATPGGSLLGVTQNPKAVLGETRGMVVVITLDEPDQSIEAGIFVGGSLNGVTGSFGRNAGFVSGCYPAPVRAQRALEIVCLRASSSSRVKGYEKGYR